MSNVTSLNGGPTREQKPDPECVEAVERLLERAKSGDVIGVAFVVGHYDGDNGAGWAGSVGGWGMIGALQCLIAKFTTTSVEQDF